MIKLLTWLAESWEAFSVATIASSMWVEGYTDFEIEQYLKDLNEQ